MPSKQKVESVKSNLLKQIVKLLSFIPNKIREQVDFHTGGIMTFTGLTFLSSSTFLKDSPAAPDKLACLWSFQNVDY
jgi:hypothetical protein